MLANLSTLLPYLALAGLALEATPVAAKHGITRHPRDHIKHAQRAKLADRSPIGAQARPRIIKRADGSQCRVRPSATPATTVEAAVQDGASDEQPADDNSGGEQPAGDNSAAVEQGDQNQGGEASADQNQGGDQAAADQNQGGDQAAGDQNQGQSAGDQNQGGDQVSAAPPAESTPAAPAPPSTNHSVQGGKYGFCWANDIWVEAGPLIGSRGAWYYTWSASPVSTLDSAGLEFVPMLWGPGRTDQWYQAMPNWPSVKHALFYNEPNQHDQAGVDTWGAIGDWMNVMVPLRQKGITLGGAATTSAPDGLVWVNDFKTNCQSAGNSAADCDADFMPIHWYDTTVEKFQSYATQFHQSTGKNLWVTEYACQDFNGQGIYCGDYSWTLHQTMAAWFDQQDWIERYSPFAALQNMVGVEETNRLINGDKSPTDLGLWYANRG